jgi:diacylglycerol kinase family enzyme
MSVGGFKGLVTQDVALDDGEFEVLLIRTPKTPLDLTNIINYMFLKEEPNEYVHKFRTRSLRILSEEPIDWVLDGEFGGTRREVNIINLKKRIRIMRKTPKKQ